MCRCYAAYKPQSGDILVELNSSNTYELRTSLRLAGLRHFFLRVSV